MATVITIPYKPREAFKDFHNRIERWAVIVAHRRAGKTVACINDLIKRALTEGKAGDLFAYIAPYHSQAKAVAWQYLLEYTALVRSNLNASELWVELLNGTRIRLFGADNANALRGISLSGAICDEVADWKPDVFGSVIRPALADKQGFAVHIGTPRGHNEFYRLWSELDGFKAMIKASESGILPENELIDAKKGMTDDQYNQEFECSFEAAIKGAIYADELKKSTFSNVPHDPALPVDTWWDLGMADSTSIIFSQQVRGSNEIRIIDYYESSGEGLPHYANVLQGRGYNYKTHHAPHDIEVRELGSGRSRIETARSLGISFDVVENISLQDGINATRMVLPRCVFDQTKCRYLIEALQNYHWDYDEKLGQFRSKPVHDWSSHASDAMRYLAVGIKDQRPRERPRHRPQVSWLG